MKLVSAIFYDSCVPLKLLENQTKKLIHFRDPWLVLIMKMNVWYFLRPSKPPKWFIVEKVINSWFIRFAKNTLQCFFSFLIFTKNSDHYIHNGTNYLLSMKIKFKSFSPGFCFPIALGFITKQFWQLFSWSISNMDNKNKITFFMVLISWMTRDQTPYTRIWLFFALEL